jgi:hypothetical protein
MGTQVEMGSLRAPTLLDRYRRIRRRNSSVGPGSRRTITAHTCRARRRRAVREEGEG